MESPYHHYGWSTNLRGDIDSLLDDGNADGLVHHLRVIWDNEVSSSPVSLSSVGYRREHEFFWISLLDDPRVQSGLRFWKLIAEISIVVQSALEPGVSVGTLALANAITRLRDGAARYCIEADFAEERLSARAALAFLQGADWSLWPEYADPAARTLCQFVTLLRKLPERTFNDSALADGRTALKRLAPYVSPVMHIEIQKVSNGDRP